MTARAAHPIAARAAHPIAARAAHPIAARAAKALAGIALGIVSALAGLVFLAGAGPLLLSARARPRVLAGAVRLAALEVRRLGLLGGVEVSGYDGRRALGYLARRLPAGLLAAAVLLLLVYGIGVGVTIAWQWGRGEPFDGMPPQPLVVAYIAFAGLVLLFLEVMGLVGLVAVERRLALAALGPSPTELLRRRIAELAETRAGAVAAVDQERRRIERDLHDGVQQRLVALAVLIGRARRGRSPELLDELLGQAHAEAQEALSELREVAWRVYPSGLDTLGLRDALAGVAERAGVPVTIRYGLRERPPGPVETAAYFVVSEAVTNAVKHARASAVTVDVTARTAGDGAAEDRAEGTVVVVRTRDDGRGGADPSGGGLSGLALRVAALDGRLRVDSPPGGPTVITAELPCG
ncbi:sensor histidine kinase [Planomonospora sp. ID67723]|uniref:sensor histidine kinase n=1 Tax=Planomonospora sp. ID67723 TaxID=2738134 RepID=UPI0018C355F9|nr:histidine kinase [Planomonospora sp. ID67723]MBG0832043.1 sensor histidine kinase [Planomonospora sp. ID67723]